MSNTERTVRYIHDILAAYYEVASKRFVDNIYMQATGYCLLTGPRKLLGLFSPQFIANLAEDQDQLTEIAGENAALSRRRVQLNKGVNWSKDYDVDLVCVVRTTYVTRPFYMSKIKCHTYNIVHT